MDFADHVINYGDVPVFSVDGLSSAERVSPNKLRISYYVMSRVGDEIVKKLVLCLDWDVAVWLATWPVCKEIEPMAAAPFIAPKVIKLRKHAHH